jgi:hypothetical protein
MRAFQKASGDKIYLKPSTSQTRSISSAKSG